MAVNCQDLIPFLAIMLLNGTPKWVMILIGLIMVASGLFIWHGQGKYYGLGKEKEKINPMAIILSLILFFGILIFEFLFSRGFEIPN